MSEPSEVAVRRPNIVLFVADQLRADHLGCYGHPLAVTPNIDALAAAGTRYTECHAASSTCMPNRATMITGRMPSLHGVRRNGIPLPTWQRTFPEVLREAGYRTALFGKAHFQPFGQYAFGGPGPDPTDTVRFPGVASDYTMEFIERWQNDPGHRISEPYYGFDDVELCLYHGDGVEGDYARWLADRAPELVTARGVDHALPSPDYRARDAWRTPIPEELYPNAFIAERATKWLADHAANHPDEPFLLVCSFPDPHHPITPPGRFFDLIDPDDVTLPASFSDRSQSPFVEYTHRISADGLLPNNHIPFAPDEREARELIALTLGSTANIDVRIGEIVASVADHGLDHNTITSFTTDHGDLMGDHGVFLKVPLPFRGLTHVPFIWSDPAQADAPSEVSEVTSSLDLARTVLGAANCAVPKGMQGLDLHATAPTADRAVLIENEATGLRFDRPDHFGLRTLRTKKWNLTISNDEGLCELFNVADDPTEVRNLWADDAAADIRRDLTDRLLATMIEHGELGITNWSAG